MAASRTFVVTDGDEVAALLARDAPDALESVVDGGLEPEGTRVPDADGTVLAAAQQHRQLWMERDRRHVLHVTLQRLHARLVLHAHSQSHSHQFGRLVCVYGNGKVG